MIRQVPYFPAIAGWSEVRLAGKYGTWRITYTAGSLGIDSGGQIKVAIRLVSDWEAPQFDDPYGSGFSTVTTSGNAKVRASWQPRGYVRPWSKALVIDVYDGSLLPNDTITIVLGDTSQGAPGIRAQTYLESEFEFKVLVDPTNSTDPRPIPQRLTMPIVAAEMAELVALLPSQAQVGEPIDIFVKGEDMWRNPTPVEESVAFTWIGPGNGMIDENQQFTVDQVGVGYLEARTGQFHCRSNPIEIRESDIGSKRFWGDLHAQTGGTVGVGSDDEYFRFGRDVAKLDFTSHQGNDFQIDDAYWSSINHTAAQYHHDGSFVVFPGYEWSASSPTGGDHNVFYRKEGLPIMRSSHWLIPHVAESDLSPAHPADQFYAKMKAAVPSNEVIVAQHVGGRYANLLSYFDQELISLVELVSVWGVFEWMLWDAIDRGYVVGVMGNSDGHHGRPGAEGAGMMEFGIKNGLTCVLSEGLTRDQIFNALKNRTCYATTGERMLLDFELNGRPMGSIIDQRPETIEIAGRVMGAGPLESLQLFQGREVIAEVRPPAFMQLDESNHIRISWQGCRERGRQRRATWDGAVRAEGCQIISAATFSFDVVADGIESQSPNEIIFKSKTTGDRDGLDLILSDASAGTLIFESALGKTTVDLATLTSDNPIKSFDYGGVDLKVVVERYPESSTVDKLEMNYTLQHTPNQLTPYFIKATQIDGNMAWASPVWIK
ncbi:MAG: DUF3604 domain-containing protein [Chloroflexota bacterium]